MAKKKFKDNPFKSRKATKAMKNLMRKVKKKMKEELGEAHEKARLIYGEPVEHDDKACQALIEYENAWQYPFRRGPGPNMGAIARKHNTTTDAMKKHFDCLPDHLKTKPFSR